MCKVPILTITYLQSPQEISLELPQKTTNCKSTVVLNCRKEKNVWCHRSQHVIGHTLSHVDHTVIGKTQCI